jgi:predicted kinase/predicted phosphodiesterase
MRKLILLSGIPGCGKSTFIDQHNLQGYTLSPDQIRLDLQPPDMTIVGNVTIVQDNDQKVWNQLYERLEDRMKHGELVIIDATHTQSSYFDKYLHIAGRYRYTVVVVDFRYVELETCQVRNQNRPEFKKVPDKVIQKMYENIQKLTIPTKIKVSKPQDFRLTKLDEKLRDFSHYNRIIHIGDVQGVDDALADYFQAYPFDERNLYIFTGDLIDRGLQNHLVVTRMIDLLSRDNVILIEGNHDTYLWDWACNRVVDSREFAYKTKPQLEENHINKGVVAKALKNMQPLIYYQYGDLKVLLTHGGLSNLPDEYDKLSTRTCIKGVGKYGEVMIVDDTFVNLTKSNVYQIHGHRNMQSYPTQINSRCFNLEGKVEFGGFLRVVHLDQSGFEVIEIPAQPKVSNQNVTQNNQTKQNLEENQTLIESMQKNSLVQEKLMGSMNQISSFNFTSKAFYDRKWSEQTMTARGLFINNQSKEIVIRSYNKFFNIGEFEHIELEYLAKTMQYPIQIWVKENGYLGLVGYDSSNKELVFASKSTINSEFAQWLKEQFEKLLTYKQIQLIKDFLRDNNATMVFEVIEPERDPHIIKEVGQRIVMLDFVKRQAEFERINYETSIQLALDLGIEFKQKAGLIHNPTEFNDWYDRINDLNYKYEGKHIEGFVLEDFGGLMVKIKLPFYAFWKQMRGVLEAINNNKYQNNGYKKYLDSEKAEKFINWLLTEKSENQIYKNIIEARERFDQ